MKPVPLTKAEVKALADFLTSEYIYGYRSIPLKTATMKLVAATVAK